MKCPYINPTIQQCTNCPLPDCVRDELTILEIKKSKERDREAADHPIDHKKVVRQEVNKRYWDKHKAKINHKRRERYPGSGTQKKNNERSRTYNQEHKEELVNYERAAYLERLRERQAG
jgi:hypothetical protein